MPEMRIGIDYTAAVRQGAGIGRYTRCLVEALLELDAHNEYVLLAATGGVRKVAPSQVAATASGLGHSSLDIATLDNVRVVPLPVSDRVLAILWQRLRLPLWVELACGALDVFHSPDFTLPPVRRARTVLTVHDLSFMRVPQCSDPGLRSYLLQTVPRSVRRADVVLADSECTRADVIELLDVDPARVVVVYPGVEERFRRVRDAVRLDEVRTRYGLPGRFVLGLGTLQPRKNFERLIEAYARVRGEVGTEIALVIAGGKGWMYGGIFERVDELGLQDAVCFPGYVSDQDLPALYSLADLFAFPSLYEGFGIPPLEAMACGTPVVVANVSSLPEAVGDAAVMVDPLDVDALAEAMRCILVDASMRQQMAQRGVEWARRFTWDQAANRLLNVYQGMS
jgi:glycosyltransferase involved in cell wall biosynthesis